MENYFSHTSIGYCTKCGQGSHLIDGVCRDCREPNYTLCLVDDIARRNTEVRMIAKDMARRGFTGKPGELLPDAISSAAHIWINNNPYAFKLMVREYVK